jgi:hypothetical protein
MGNIIETPNYNYIAISLDKSEVPVMRYRDSELFVSKEPFDSDFCGLTNRHIQH